MAKKTVIDTRSYQSYWESFLALQRSLKFHRSSKHDSIFLCKHPLKRADAKRDESYRRIGHHIPEVQSSPSPGGGQERDVERRTLPATWPK